MTHHFQLPYESDFASPQILSSLCAKLWKERKETLSLIKIVSKVPNFSSWPKYLMNESLFFHDQFVGFGHRFSKLHNICFAAFFQNEVFVTEK